MKLEIKFRVSSHPGAIGSSARTYIWIDTYVDGTTELVSERLFISGDTRDIGHLDPNVNSFDEYRQAQENSLSRRRT